jgi:hypothetical protein
VAACRRQTVQTVQTYDTSENWQCPAEYTELDSEAVQVIDAEIENKESVEEEITPIYKYVPQAHATLDRVGMNRG